MFYNLLHFKKVVEAGSISRASQLLFISQPALSKSIKTLECYYGVELLERLHQGTKPTAYGDLLYQTACDMERSFLESLNKIQDEKLKHLSGADPQEVRIGCSMIWNDFLFPDVMKSMERPENLIINITSDTSENLLNDLVKKNRYDFVLCRIIEGKRFDSLSSLPLLKSQAAIFIDDHNPIFSEGIDTERLHQLKWVKLRNLPVLKRRDLTPEGLALIPEDFLPPTISFEVEDLMAAIQLLRNNYIILLPLALAGLLEKYNIKPLPFSKDMTKEYWLGLVYQKQDHLPLYIDNLMNRIRLFFSYK